MERRTALLPDGRSITYVVDHEPEGPTIMGFEGLTVDEGMRLLREALHNDGWMAYMRPVTPAEMVEMFRGD